MESSIAAAPGLSTFIDEPPLSPTAPNGLRIARPAAAQQAPAPAAAPAPQPVAAQPAPVAPAPVAPAAPVAETPAETEIVFHTLTLRLNTGELLGLERFADYQAALRSARLLTRKIEENEWPFVDGRFIRPAAIVSLDVLADS